MKNFKKPSTEELKRKLTPLQYEVTQKEGTEAAFKNEYWDHKEDGIYVDIVSGEALFSSLDKYDSGSGWPSFSKTLEKDNILEKEDHRLFSKRTEIRSKKADSHLGHVFNDGPTPSGLRYCINSAALKFIPVKQLAKEGYEKYLSLFSKKETAIFAAGCFWGVEEILRKIPGVIKTTVGYSGGTTNSPNYQQIKLGETGHAEAVKIIFDPAKISYRQLLEYFFRLHDPTTLNRQGNDIGDQYRSAIFFLNEEQQKVAAEVKKEIDASGKWPKKVVTEIIAAKPFYPAEDYHQDYLQKNPNGYTCHYLRD